MNYHLSILIIIIAFILLLFFIRLILPHTGRQEIFFGVRMPEALLQDPGLNDLKKAYIRNYCFVCGIYTILFCVLLAQTMNNAVLIAGIIVFFLLSSWLYYVTHQRVMEFKAANDDGIGKRQVVMVDTRFRNDKYGRILPSKAWFFLPLGIIVINILAGYYAYDSLPMIVPTHWNELGMTDGGVFKTYGIIYVFPVVQFFITILAFILYMVVGWAKQEINAANPEESKERSRLFRYRWGANIIFLSSLSLLLLSILNFFILQIIPPNMMLLFYAQPLLITFILLDILLMSVWTGQGGSRVHLQSNSPKAADSCGPDDDRNWLGGLIYFNPRDPALFVEKRFGIAWGLNYGSIKAYLLIAALIGSLFLLSAVLEMMLFY